MLRFINSSVVKVTSSLVLTLAAYPFIAVMISDM